MKIIELRALRGPNYYSNSPVILMELDIEELEEKPSDLVPGFRKNLETILPSLYEHNCSPGKPGGFFERIDRGTWAGHIVEHIAIELQCLIGHKVSFGKAFSLKEKGVYNIVYRYLNEDVGIRAGEMAVEIVEKLFENELTNIEPLLKELQSIYESTLLGPSTKSIVDEAAKRGISHIRLNKDSYVQLGQGKYQRKIQATVVDSTSSLGVEIAGNKERTKEILGENGIPVPEGEAVDTINEAINLAKKIGYPVVVKPLRGNHGRGVTTNITTSQELEETYDLARKIDSYVVVEKYLIGYDFRMMVIDGKFQAAALREPAFVIGNGVDSVRKLIEKTNEDPNRGEGHEKILTKIHIDSETERVLELEGMNLDSIPELGQKVYAKATANLSSGGTAIDVTEKVHPFNQIMAERIYRLIGLNIIGIDIIAKTLEEPLEMGKSGIVEVNAGPGFRMHLYPSEGKPRNIAKAVVDMLFPEGTPHSIPICAVTETNGKTTTTRLISHILAYGGNKVGISSTAGVFIDGVQILKGDYSGPEGAKAVLRDNTIDHAVLEVARGGILRRGLGFRDNDVGVMTNVTSDHLGQGGIDDLESLSRLKSTVLESVKKTGWAVVNADDPMSILRLDKIKSKIILFSKDKDHPLLKENLKKNHVNVTIKNEHIILQTPELDVEIAEIDLIPITFQGLADFNIENAMAVVGATYGLGVKEEIIQKGLYTFNPSITQSPGRMNIIDIGDFKVLIDYCHNIGAIKVTANFVKSLMPGKKIRLSSGVGNRRAEDIIEYGKVLAKHFDEIVISDPAPRSRKPGETALILKKGIMEGGMAEEKITVTDTERKGTQIALRKAGPGDLVILQVDNVEQMIEDVLEFKKEVFSNMLDIEE